MTRRVIRACPLTEDAVQRTFGGGAGASLRSGTLRTLPNDSSSAGRLPSTSSSHGARGVLGLNAQRNQSMESYSTYMESIPSRASEAVWKNKAGPRLTLCSDEPPPPVCMSIHPEGKSCPDLGSSACFDDPPARMCRTDRTASATVLATARSRAAARAPFSTQSYLRACWRATPTRTTATAAGRRWSA